MLTEHDFDRIRLIIRQELSAHEARGTGGDAHPDMVQFLRSLPPGDVPAAELYTAYIGSPAGPRYVPMVSKQLFGRRAVATGLVARRHTREGEVYTILAPENLDHG